MTSCFKAFLDGKSLPLAEAKEHLRAVHLLHGSFSPSSIIPTSCGQNSSFLSSQVRNLVASETSGMLEKITVFHWLCRCCADIIKFQRIPLGSRKCFSWFHDVRYNWRLPFLSVTSMFSVTRTNNL